MNKELTRVDFVDHVYTSLNVNKTCVLASEYDIKVDYAQRLIVFRPKRASGHNGDSHYVEVPFERVKNMIFMTKGEKPAEKKASG